MRRKLARREPGFRGKNMRTKSLGLAAIIVLGLAQPIESQTLPAQPVMSYADLADLALAAPVVAHVRVKDADALSARDSPNVRAGHTRFVVDADVVALIRGDDGLPVRVSYLVDIPNDARGRAARIRGRTEYLVLANRPPADRPAELRLIAPDRRSLHSRNAARLRGCCEITAGRPPRSPASAAPSRSRLAAGASETQIFLQTADNRPISLNVLAGPARSRAGRSRWARWSTTPRRRRGETALVPPRLHPAAGAAGTEPERAAPGARAIGADAPRDRAASLRATGAAADSG